MQHLKYSFFTVIICKWPSPDSLRLTSVVSPRVVGPDTASIKVRVPHATRASKRTCG